MKKRVYTYSIISKIKHPIGSGGLASKLSALEIHFYILMPFQKIPAGCYNFPFLLNTYMVCCNKIMSKECHTGTNTSISIGAILIKGPATLYNFYRVLEILA